MTKRDYEKNLVQRDFNLEVREVEKEDRTLEFPFSSEEPVQRYFGLETLEHREQSADLGRLNDGIAGVRIGIPENYFFVAAILGGWPMGFLTMKTIRHKTVKKSFQVKYFLSSLLNILIIGIFIFITSN